MSRLLICVVCVNDLHVMLLQNKQNTIGDKMTKAVSDALRAPLAAATTSPHQQRTTATPKPRTPLGVISSK